MLLAICVIVRALASTVQYTLRRAPRTQDVAKHSGQFLGDDVTKTLTPPFAPANSISYKTDAFPLPSDVYWIYSMNCATTSPDVVTLTFDLLTLRVCHVQRFSCLTHIPIFIIL